MKKGPPNADMHPENAPILPAVCGKKAGSARKKRIRMFAAAFCFPLFTFLIVYLLFGTRYFMNGEAYDGNISAMSALPIAHRGLFTALLDENSLSAFENAIENGYPIEMDLRPTADNDPMVIHDNNLKRLTGQDVNLSSLSSEEAREYTLLKTGEAIPTLQEALAYIDGRVPLLIEIKSNSRTDAYEANIVSILRDYEGVFALASFNPWTCRYVKRIAPEFCVGLILDDPKGYSLGFLRTLKDNLYTSICRPNFIAYNIDLVSPGMLSLYRNAGVPVFGYTMQLPAVGVLSYMDRVDNVIIEGLE